MKIVQVDSLKKIKILIAYWALSEVDKKCQRVSCTTTKLNEIKRKLQKIILKCFGPI